MAPANQPTMVAATKSDVSFAVSCFDWICSDAKISEPVNSPPMLNPWMIRKNTKSKGAINPAWVKVGRHLMSNEEHDMPNKDSDRDAFLPLASPIKPKMMAPKGRAKKLTAKTEKPKIRVVMGLAFGKNRGDMTGSIKAKIEKQKKTTIELGPFCTCIHSKKEVATSKVLDLKAMNKLIDIQLKDGKNFFETGNEHFTKYLPARIAALYYYITDNELYSSSDKNEINLGIHFNYLFFHYDLH